jgi:hypothetical protein
LRQQQGGKINRRYLAFSNAIVILLKTVVRINIVFLTTTNPPVVTGGANLLLLLFAVGVRMVAILFFSDRRIKAADVVVPRGRRALLLVPFPLFRHGDRPRRRPHRLGDCLDRSDFGGHAAGPPPPGLVFLAS